MGRPHDAFGAAVWGAVLAALDERLESTTRAYVQSRFLGASDIAAGFSQLAMLRHAKEPDYAVPGVAVAYAFRYLPARVVGILGAFTLLPNGALPHRILDVGSGSGATSIALSLLEPTHPVQLDAVEPSFEMRGFANLFPLHPLVSVRHVPGSVQDLTAAQIPLSPDDYDLVMTSACLFYDDRGQQPVVSWLRSAHAPAPVLIAIEPEAKKPLLERLARGLQYEAGYDVALSCCHSLPKTMRQPRALPLATALLNEYEPYLRVNAHISAAGRRLLGFPPYPVNTWSAARNVSFLVACDRREDPRTAAVVRIPRDEAQARSTMNGLRARLRRWLSRIMQSRQPS